MKRPIITDAVCPLREKYEVINILVTEQQLMEYVRRNDTSPATLMSLLMARAINLVHPDRVDQIPTLAARHEAMKGLTQRTQTMTSCFISYVGKANFGASERYIREMYTEVYSTHAMGAELSTINGTFCISFMHLFTTDAYLDAFLDELRQQGIGYEIADRHKVMLAPIPDYRENMR